MTSPLLLGEIVAEAERIRADGTLPEGFERSLAETFAVIAADPAALQAELEQHRSERQHSEAGSDQPSVAPTERVRHLLGRARRGARRRIGPPVRRLQRRGVERAAALAAEASVRMEVTRERVERLVGNSRLERVLTPVRGAAVGLPPPPSSLRFDAGRLGDDGLDEFVLARLHETSGAVLCVGCGDGSFSARLRALGRDTTGAEPGVEQARLGGLTAIKRCRPASLGAIVVSGISDALTPARARALVHLAASRLTSDGVIVILSASPDRDALDPVAADLTVGRPFHSVTWRHLFAELGLERIVVQDARDGSSYAVSGRSGSAR